MTRLAELRALLAKATHGPWEAGEERHCDTVFRVPSGAPDDDGEIVARCYTPEDVALVVAAINALPALLDVAEAARAWSECVEQGFASDLRPDIARAMLNRALRKLDMVPNVHGVEK